MLRCKRAKLFSPGYILLLSIFFWLPMENTLLGRGYTHLIGLNEAGVSKTSLTTESLIISVQAAFMFTIFVPTVMLLVSPPAQPARHKSMSLVRIGLCAWLTGAIIATIAHYDNGLVVLNLWAGLVSGVVVFVAIRRVTLETPEHIEWILMAAATGIIIPVGYDLFRYYAYWGIPTASSAIRAKYDVTFWSSNCYFGNPNNASNVYGIFSHLMMPAATSKVFSKKVRCVAWVTLAMALAATAMTMARTGLVFAAVGWVATAVFFRNYKGLLAGGLLLVVGTTMLGQGDDVFSSYMLPALSYDATTDRSTAARLDTMRQGWSELLDHPVVGLGPYQSTLVIAESETHQLGLWQGVECGVFGILGVLAVTAGCLWRLVTLLLRGPGAIGRRIEFVFLLPPALYFLRGLASDVTINLTVVNTWICLVFAAFAVADRRWNALFRQPRPAVALVEVRESAHA